MPMINRKEQMALFLRLNNRTKHTTMNSELTSRAKMREFLKSLAAAGVILLFIGLLLVSFL